MNALPRPTATDESLAFIRTALDEDGYHLDEVRRRLDLRPPQRDDSINGDLRSGWRARWSQAVARHGRRPRWDELDVLIRLFEVGEAVDVGVARRTLGAKFLEECTACGLLATADGRTVPRLLLSCVGDVRVLTDLDDVANDPAIAGGGANPLVMPVYVETHLFADAVPRDPIGWGLDLCTGCGVHALLMAGHCEHVVGTDVSPRAVAIAELNARLNGIDNVTFVVGPLWCPVGGRRFDLVTANPPYQPEPDVRPGSNWWGAEARGEAVWRPMLERLHEHLTPQGRGVVILQGLSWTDDPFTARVQQYAPTLRVHFDRFGSPDLDAYRRRYAGHPSLGKRLQAADYGVLHLASGGHA